MKLLLLFLTVFCSKLTFSQTSIPKEFKKAVAFIYIKDSSGKFVPTGTGFYMAVRKDSVTFYGYLITAKHVIRRMDGTYLGEIFIRIPGLKDTLLQHLSKILVYNLPSRNVHFHSDTTVDVAVISGLFDNNKYDFSPLPEDFLVTKSVFDSLKISEGNEVFFTGLFTPYIGEKANYPITRFGRVSLITDERVYWNGNYRNLYLIEATTYWGNSGSPVYFAIKEKAKFTNGMLLTNGVSFKLAGIINGFFGDNILGGFQETKNLRPFQLLNYGIAAVTPSYLIWEILFSEECKNERKHW